MAYVRIRFFNKLNNKLFTCSFVCFLVALEFSVFIIFFEHLQDTSCSFAQEALSSFFPYDSFYTSYKLESMSLDLILSFFLEDKFSNVWGRKSLIILARYRIRT